MKITKRQLRRIIREARMGEYGKIDAEDGNPPTKIGRGNEEYMASYNAVLQARGEEPLDIQKPDQAYLDALRSGQLQETVRKIISKRQLRRIIREERARLMEQPDVPDVMGAMGGGKFQPRPGLDPEIAAKALAELKNDGWLSMIQTATTDAAGDLDRLSDQVDTKLLDAGLNELAMDLRNVVKMLDKIREAAHKQR